ncbi:MAG: type VI secretion system-associated protein TagO [Bauldia sp.]
MRTRNLAFVACIALSVTEAGAQTPTTGGVADALAACAMVVADAERLACFDRVTAAAGARPVAPLVVQPPAQAQGAWANRTERDAMTDFVSSFWTLQAVSTIPDGVIGTVRPVLVVRCQNDRTSIYIDWNRFVTTDLDNRHPVTTRVDSAPSARSDWSLSTDFEATFAASPIPFLRTLAGATTLLAETTPFASSPVRAEFSVTGIDRVIEDVSTRCGW